MTTTQALTTLRQIWQQEPETFEFYASPILQGAHNRKLRCEIYGKIYRQVALTKIKLL